MKRRAVRPDRERGEALAELLVTIVIIGITVVAIVGALADSILASSTHRQYASGDTIAKCCGDTQRPHHRMGARRQLSGEHVVHSRYHRIQRLVDRPMLERRQPGNIPSVPELEPRTAEAGRHCDVQ